LGFGFCEVKMLDWEGEPVTPETDELDLLHRLWRAVQREAVGDLVSAPSMCGRPSCVRVGLIGVTCGSG
jgi:hypothetical protein